MPWSTNIEHPALQAMIYTRNSVAEPVSDGVLIRQYAEFIKHVDINEMDGRHPRMQTTTSACRYER